MASSDPIADVLTKVRNASRAKHSSVEIRPSKLAQRMLQVMQEEGYIRAYKSVGTDPITRTVRVYLKYAGGHPAIKYVKRVSKPGQRVYRKADTMPRVLNGLGTVIVSTSTGVMTGREAYQKRIGGEILCYVW